MRAGAAAAKAAKVGIAFVVSPAAGLREAGVALVDTLVKSDPEMKLALNQVTAELTGLARARRYSCEQSRTAFRSMQDLLEFHKLSVDELAELGFDPIRATNTQLAKGAPLMRTLSQDESDLTEQAVLSLYRAVLSNPKLLPGRDEAFQRRVLVEQERLALSAQARAQPVDQLRARLGTGCWCAVEFPRVAGEGDPGAGRLRRIRLRGPRQNP
jgi:hypothetical protein